VWHPRYRPNNASQRLVCLSRLYAIHAADADATLKNCRVELRRRCVRMSAANWREVGHVGKFVQTCRNCRQLVVN